MNILLTTPKNVGSLDPVGSYTHAQIRRIEINPVLSVVVVDARLGTMNQGAFVLGSVEIPNETSFTFAVQGADYIAMIALLCSATDKKIFDETYRVIYEWIISKGYIPGTVE